MSDTRIEDLPGTRTEQRVRPAGCVLCRLPIRFLRDVMRLVRSDGARVWMCAECFDTPVERVFVQGV
jgi:Zn-finger protein